MHPRGLLQLFSAVNTADERPLLLAVRLSQAGEVQWIAKDPPGWQTTYNFTHNFNFAFCETARRKPRKFQRHGPLSGTHRTPVRSLSVSVSGFPRASGGDAVAAPLVLEGASAPFMKIFLAVLCALLIAFSVGRSVLAQDHALEKWRSTKNGLAAQIELSFRRSHEISEGMTVDTVWSDGERLRKEDEARRDGMETLIALLEHKPSGELTEAERAQLKDVKAALVDANKPSVEDTPAPVASVPKATPTPKPTPPSAAFLADVGYSQKAALTKYPQLGVKGSPLNTRFLVRLDEWKARGDDRLSRSDWPEKLAADCYEHP